MMTRHQQAHIVRSRQSGASLIEAVLGLALVAACIVAFSQALSSDREDLMLASVASRISEVRSAADRYIRDNFSTLETAATAGPVDVPISLLVTGNYLPQAFGNTNEYGQTHEIYVRRRAPGVLESLVVTMGGRAMNQVEGGKVATLLKSPGGFIPIGSSTATGTRRGWNLMLAHIVPSGRLRPSGHPAAYSLTRKVEGPNGALMRDDTGNPADNRMSTSLDMAGNDILNIGNLKVGNTTINQTTVENISDLASVSCANGQVLTKVGSSIMCITPASGVPSGGVVGFMGSCPSGWSVLEGASGRVLIGAGRGRPAGEIGGRFSLTLTEAHLPPHSHKVATTGTRYDWELKDGQGYTGTIRAWSETGGDTEYTMNTTDNPANVGNSSVVGSGAEIVLDPANIAVQFCQKN